MDRRFLELVRCPMCRGPLKSMNASDIPSVGRSGREAFRCVSCNRVFGLRDGLALLYEEGEVRGTDRLMRGLYNTLHRWHDPAVRFVLPLLEFGTEKSLRDGYMRRLDLGAIVPGDHRGPVRILEVGVGAGANLPLVLRDLPRGLQVEIWGLDLSAGMLAECRRRIDKAGMPDVHLLMADAHRLPFGDATFDRVFHVGGIGGFREPGLALAEMARVARPGTPIVVVDEQLDESRRNLLYHRLMFRALTFYDPDPRAPRHLLPAGAIDVMLEQVSRFYYCLTFSMPKS